MTSGACWVCGSNDLASIFRVDDVPSSSLILMETEGMARSFPTGDIDLVVCGSCSFIFNRLFDPEAVDYTMPYEESQSFSPRFKEFEDALVDRLISDYDLPGRSIFEIGCGKASFLEAICRRAGAKGLGIDPAFDPRRISSDVGIEVLPEFFDEDHTDLTGDLICCRHTLEHIQPVADFVGLVRQSAVRTEGSVVFFEVPDVERILAEGAFWDIYYEHCSYFAEASLSYLFRSSGFDVIRLRREFDSQYLLLDAAPGDFDNALEATRRDTIVSVAKTFGQYASSALDIWRHRLDEARSEGKTVALWGASSKTVSFVSAMPADAIELAIDINPFKQSKFLPGSGLPVVGPSELRPYDPDLIVVMNPVYEAEIARMVADLGLQPELVSLSGPSERLAS